MGLLKKLKRRAMQLPDLVEAARGKKTSAERGPPPDLCRAIVPSSRLGSIEVLLSAMEENGVEHWHVSMKLYPPGRSSIEDDWRKIGFILAELGMLTGLPREKMPVELTPIAENDPNAPHHWSWHADGSDCPIPIGPLRDAIAASRAQGKAT